MDKKESHPLRRKVILDSIWNLAAMLIGRLGGLIFTIIAARMLLPEGFGLYNLAISVALIFATFADLGINQALIRYVSFEIGKDKNKAAAYYHYLLKMKLFLAAATSIALLLLSYVLANYLFHKPELMPLLIILSIYIFIITIESFYECTFYIQNKVRYIAMKESVFQIIRLATFFAAIYLLAKLYYVIGAIAGLALTMLAVFCAVFYFSRKILHLEKPKNYEKYIDKKRLFKFVGFLTVANMSAALFSYMDIVMLGIFLSAEYIGYYKAAVGFVFAIMATINFSGVFLSTLTRVSALKLQETFDKIINYSLVLIVPAIAGMAMLAPYFVVLLYGYDYLPSSSLLYYLSPILVLAMIVSLFSTLLSSKEKTKDLAYLTILCLVINIALNYFLINYLRGYSELAATKGAAVAMLLSWIIYAIGILRIAKKQLGVRFKFSLLIKPAIASLVMAAALYFMRSFNADMTPLKGILEVCAGALIYFAVLLAIRGLKREDLMLFYNIILRKK